jgi:hypothetical protein
MRPPVVQRYHGHTTSLPRRPLDTVRLEKRDLHIVDVHGVAGAFGNRTFVIRSTSADGEPGLLGLHRPPGVDSTQLV